MDHSFFLRAKRLLDRERATEVDHRMMVAALAAHQAASPTARASAGDGQPCGKRGSGEPLPEIILGSESWRDAAAAQGGCFNRSIAGRRVNGS